MKQNSAAPVLCALLSSIQIEVLNEFVTSYLTSKAISDRSKIILYAFEKSNYFISKILNISFKTVKKWANRWIRFMHEFSRVVDRPKMKKLILRCLEDASRSGRPSKFTPEQVAKVIHLACSNPQSLNVPLSHWSSRTLAKFIQDQGIISQISHERVAFFLRNLHLKPHKTQYWLNSRTRNSHDYEDRIKNICELYKSAIDMYRKGIHLISVDEKSGIQAIERAEPNLPMRPRSPEKIEHEYNRHGTLCLIGNFEVAKGQIIAPMVSPTRKNDDFLQNIKNLISTDPQAGWIFILDQLNTHKSEALVKFIALENNYKGDLGKSGPYGKGILKSMESRMLFLENPNHRIRFQFTPKHCSWMNQIEI